MVKVNEEVKKPKVDARVASYTFLAIIFVTFLVGMAIGASGADTRTNFWEASVAMIIQYGAFLGLFFIVFWQLKLRGKEIPQSIDLNKKVSFRNLGFVVLIAAVTLVGFMLLTDGFLAILRTLGYSSCVVEKCVDGTAKCWTCGDGLSVPQYIMAVFVVCLLPAVIEELLFRGLILKGLTSMGKVVAIIASAVLFSLFHGNVDQTIHQFILGIICAVVVLKTGNLVYAMVLHFLNNFIWLTAYTFIGSSLESAPWNPLTAVVMVVLAGLGVLMLVGLVKALKPHDERAVIQKTTKFWSLYNIGYFIAVVLGGCIWVFALLAGLGVV